MIITPGCCFEKGIIGIAEIIIAALIVTITVMNTGTDSDSDTFELTRNHGFWGCL